MRYRGMRTILASTAAAYAIVMAAPALAQTKSFNVPEQSASTGIPELARQADIQILVSEGAARGKTTRAVKGNMSVEAALQRLLRGTGLRISSSDGRTITLVAVSGMTIPGEATAGSTAANSESADIVVTGSRIQGAPTTSPTIVLTAEQMRLAGQMDLGEAMRSLPQNFASGQNPAVVRGVGSSGGVNLTSGSSPNLRGLGADATLTLMNGHRLSYGSTVQAVDISAIPLAAVDRIDIVPDGSSAIYGSDAVGGVINVILKRDYDGASLAATLGGATSGGDFQQQYSAVAGKVWKNGGVLAAVSHDYNSAVYSGDREYTEYMPSENTLYPKIVQTNAVLYAHQSIGNSIDTALDATYSRMTSFRTQNQVNGYIYENRPKTTSYSFSPSIGITIAPEWQLRFMGTYGTSDTQFDQVGIRNGVQTSRSSGCYCNDLVNVEAFASGKIHDVLTNPIGIVIGGGYRYNHLKSVRYSATRADSNGSTESYYGFSELSLPFVEPGQGGKLVYRLAANAAVRYERYPGIAAVAVPKFGFLYGISPSLDLKATWGKSFKAPTLNQLGASTYAQLYSAADYGGQRFPTGSTLLIASGGNPDLKPEKATSWSASLAVHPEQIKYLKVQATYFNVKYRDRVVLPLAGTIVYQALSNAAYSQYVTYNPSQSVVNATVSGADLYYNYATANGLNDVVAILKNGYMNAARQKVDGIDLSIDYKINTNDRSSILINANGAWLWSKQKLSSTDAYVDMAGIIFNPPRFKARASIGWSDGNFTSMFYANHISSLKDNRSTTPTKVASQTTFDASFRYQLPRESGPLAQLSIILNVQNMFNQRPPYAAPTSGGLDYVNYDSTNFSPIGRFISLTVSKGW